MLPIKENITAINRTLMTKRAIVWLVIHWTGSIADKDLTNGDCSAENNAIYFKTVNRQASAHLFVDEDSIVRVVKDKDVAWHCGTTGTYFHPSCRNTNSIGIEMTVSPNGGISDQVLKNTAELVQFYMKLYGIDANHVIRHYDVTHKLCPSPYTNDAKWAQVRAILVGENKAYSEVVVTSASILEIKAVQKWLNTFKGNVLAEDGVFGRATNKGLVIALQIILNEDYKKKLVVDGGFGAKTKAECPVLKLNDTGRAVKLMEAILFCQGFNPSNFDGNYTTTVKKAVGLFQEKEFGSADYLFGKNSFEKGLT